jgi:hypothetical protein
MESVGHQWGSTWSPDTGYNKDNKRGVTNTYHLMFLFERLHNEAVGRESGAEKMFSKHKVRISAPAQSA